MIARIRSIVQGHSGRVTVGVAAGLAMAVVAAVVALLVVVAGPSGTTSATDVTPTLISGNPDCDASGVGELVRVDPVADGTFSVAGGSITIVVDNGAKTFDWTSTVGIGLIIVKGGPNANEYVYVPASFGDTGLHAPLNPKNNRFYGLSHISFCDPGESVTPTPTPTPTDTPPPTITPEDEEEKCTDRKGCPTPEPKPTATPKGDPEPNR